MCPEEECRMVVVVAELWPFLNILPDFFHERRRGGGVRKVVGKAAISKCVWVCVCVCVYVCVCIVLVSSPIPTLS